MSTTIKTIADMIQFYTAERVLSAQILPIGGDANTGNHSYWIPATSLDLSNAEDTDAEIVRELPDRVFLAADGSVWKITA